MADLGFGAGIQTAPGVYTRETDLTQRADITTASVGALAGIFAWGPVLTPTLIGSEDQLVAKFGKPSNLNAETWFVAANYVNYGASLYVNRVGDTTNSVFSSVALSSGVAIDNIALYAVNNDTDYNVKQASFGTGVDFIAKYPGALGNSIRVNTCASASQYMGTINLQSVGGNTSFSNANTNVTLTVGSNAATITLANTAPLSTNTPLAQAQAVARVFTVGDLISVGNTSIGSQTLKITSIGLPVVGNTAGTNTGIATIQLNFDQPLKITGNVTSSTLNRQWQYSSVIGAPTVSTTVAAAGSSVVDTVHVVITDELGLFTGRPGAVLETFTYLSRATDGKTADNEPNYFKTVLNNQSKYVWEGLNPSSLPSSLAVAITAVVPTTPYSVALALGTDGLDEASISLATIMTGFDVFNHKDEYNISAAIVGKTRGGLYGEQILNYVLDNLGETRQDIVVYGSSSKETTVSNVDPLTASLNFRSVVRRTSYGFLDSGYKYQYDKYNDKFRYIPLCGDIAGISCLTDITNDPWYSPAGYNRGQIKNMIKLAYNPTPSDQAVLFNNDINPVVTARGEGTFLLGDKTLLGQQSALNQLGTRKMLNILKTSIARAARVLLFEFNDEFTQARFKSLVSPFLRDVQGRRGIKRYGVVADDTNNTDQVINANQFVGSIFFIPNRSIRTIFLNFIAVGSNVQFDEVVA